MSLDFLIVSIKAIFKKWRRVPLICFTFIQSFSRSFIGAFNIENINVVVSLSRYKKNQNATYLIFFEKKFRMLFKLRDQIGSTALGRIWMTSIPRNFGFFQTKSNKYDWLGN